MKPTEKNLRTLKPGEHRDPRLPGFMVRVTPTKRHFEIRYTYKAEQCRLNIGNANLMSMDEAREHARQLLAGIKRGEDPRAAVGRSKTLTIEELGRQYFEWAEAQKKPFRQMKERRRIWDTMIEADLGGLDTTHVTRARLRVWGERHAERAGYMANRAFELLRAVYRWAIRRDVIDATPFYELERPFSGEEPRTRYLSIEEVRALLAALRDLPFGLSDMVMLLLLTGVRKSSAMLARWNEFSGMLWQIPASRMKSGRPHDVPLSTQTQALLARQRERVPEGEQLFPLTDGGDRTDATVSRPFLRQMNAHMASHLGRTPDPWTLHDLRRTVASHLADSLGIRIDVIAAILSHATGSRQTRIYALGELLAERREALQRWGDLLESLMPPEGDRLVDQKVAARLAGVSVVTMEQYRWGRFKRLGPPFVKIERRVFYRVSDLEKWSRSKKVAQTLPRGPDAPRRVHRKGSI